MSKARKTAEIERDRRNISRLYLKGVYQSDIAGELGISQATVSRDLKVIQAEWKVERVHDINERKNIELARVDNLELEYWEAWKRSQEDAETKTKKAVKIGSDENATTRSEAQNQLKGQVGDPRYLRGVEWCINKRCELLGLDAAKEINLAGNVSVVGLGIDTDKI